MKPIGKETVIRTQQRLRDKEAPDGTPWAPNPLVTEKRKDHGLVREGESKELAKQVSYNPSSDSVECGSLMIYAAMQNFGGTKAELPHLWSDIPRREFIGLNDDDEDEVLGIFVLTIWAYNPLRQCGRVNNAKACQLR